MSSPRDAAITLAEVERLLSALDRPLKIFDLLLYRLFADGKRRATLRVGAIAPFLWLAERMPSYTADPVRIRSLARRQGVLLEAVRDGERWIGLAHAGPSSGMPRASAHGRSQALAMASALVAFVREAEKRREAAALEALPRAS